MHYFSVKVKMNLNTKTLVCWTIEVCFLKSATESLYFFFVSLGGVRLSPLGTSATVDLLYQPP
jgi:hypothetical protein